MDSKPKSPTKVVIGDVYLGGFCTVVGMETILESFMNTSDLSHHFK